MECLWHLLLRLRSRVMSRACSNKQKERLRRTTKWIGASNLMVRLSGLTDEYFCQEEGGACAKLELVK